MIEVQGLTKQYGSLLAVSDLNFKIAKGSVSGIVGPNGAGKSTTLRIVAGVLGPTRGTVRLCGHDIVSAPQQARACLGYLAENAPLYSEMSPRKYLLYRAALKGLPRAERDRSMVVAAEAAGCADCLDTRIEHLSRGQRQRVGLADALIADPPVLLLDEPTTGLDQNQARELRALLCNLREQHAILVSSQVLAEIEAFCTHLLVLHRGKLIADDTIEALRARHDDAEVRLHLRDPEHRAAAIIAEAGWLLCSSLEYRPLRTLELRIKTAGHVRVDDRVESLVAALTASGVGIQAVERNVPSLENIIEDLTRGQQRVMP